MSNPKYSVLVFPKAEDDFIEVRTYLEERLKTSANPLFEKVLKAIDLLEENPLIFPLIKDPYLNQLGYRMVPIDNFLLFYLISGTDVQIHRFLYGGREYRLLF